MKMLKICARNVLHWTCVAVVAVHLTASAATLIHRYDFTDYTGDGTTIVDLVGGPAWNGTLPNGGDMATITNQLILSPGYQQYVQFPPGLITNNTAITVDMWCDVGGAGLWGFLFAFGDTDPNSGTGGRCIFLVPATARLCISGGMPSWGGPEQNAFFPGLGNSTNVHLTCVIDPPKGRMLVYRDGVLVGENRAITHPLSSVWDIYNYIGRSLYVWDPYVEVTVNEFRIWSGALTGLEVAGCHVAGPDIVGSGADAGTVTNITITVPYLEMVQGGRQTATVFGRATVFTNLIYIENELCTFVSGNTNILRVDTNGVITARNLGTTTITAIHGTASNSVQITVVPLPTVLKHRYSFNDPDDGQGNYGAVIADSVGGTNGNGILPNGGDLASVPGKLVLSGAGQQYVDLPRGIISNYSAVTIETWATFQPNLPWNTVFFNFGDTAPAGHGRNYILCAPFGGRVCISGVDPGWQAEQNASSGVNWSGRTLHIVAVVHPRAGYIALYTNGVLAAINNNVTHQLTSVINNYSYINRSLYTADPYVDLTIDEFRIYDGALTAEQVAANFMLGPDLLEPPRLSVALVGANVVLSWSTNFAGFQLQSKTDLMSPVWNQVPVTPVIVGANYQVTLPATGASRFFRIAK